MKIVLASRNKHKIGELQALLREYIPTVEVLSLDDVGFTEDIVEDGENFFENAYIKARAAASTGYIGLGDDSGLSVNALDGAPGIYSARYAGEHGDDEANNRLLLKNMEEMTDRRAYYTCAMVIAYPDGHTKEAEGYMHGTLRYEGRGTGGFGYDPLFVPNGGAKTLAEYTAEEKNAISHRAEALRKLLASVREA